jgi:hypothetical protein
MTEEPSRISEARSPAVTWLKRTGALVGLALLVAAIATVWRGQDMIADALAAVRDPAPRHIALLVVAIAGNIVLTGLMFSILMSRYGRVGLVEMQAVMASATLFNFLPLRPGLFGRVAYHKAVNGIAASDTVKTIVAATFCSILVAAYLAGWMSVAPAIGFPLWIGIAAPLPVLALAGGAAGAGRPWRAWIWAAAVRYLEVLVWAVRYSAAFALIGIPLDATTALALACISIIVTLVPFVSNGLGLREWAIALAAPYLSEAVAQMEYGLTAELVNRSAEIGIVLVAGLLGVAALIRRVRGSAPSEPRP